MSGEARITKLVLHLTFRLKFISHALARLAYHTLERQFINTFIQRSPSKQPFTTLPFATCPFAARHVIFTTRHITLRYFVTCPFIRRPFTTRHHTRRHFILRHFITHQITIRSITTRSSTTRHSPHVTSPHAALTHALSVPRTNLLYIWISSSPMPAASHPLHTRPSSPTRPIFSEDVHRSRGIQGS